MPIMYVVMFVHCDASHVQHFYHLQKAVKTHSLTYTSFIFIHYCVECFNVLQTSQWLCGCVMSVAGDCGDYWQCIVGDLLQEVM